MAPTSRRSGEQATDVLALAAAAGERPRERRRVGLLARAEAAVAAAPEGRAQRAAPALGHRTEARHALRDHHAHGALALALEADRLLADLRPAPHGHRHQDLAQLLGRDGAAVEREVDLHVLGDGRRRRERLDVLGVGVDRCPVRVVVGPVAQRLDAAVAGAGTDRHEQRRLAPQLLDLLRLVRGAHRALDQQDVVRAGRSERARLGELHDLEPVRERQQLVLEVEERELAAVTRGHLHDADAESRSDGDGSHQAPSLPTRARADSSEIQGRSSSSIWSIVVVAFQPRTASALRVSGIRIGTSYAGAASVV